MKFINLVLVTIFFASKIILTADTTNIQEINIKDFKFGLTGTQLYHTCGNDYNLLLPDYYENKRNKNINDNPLLHGAAISDFSIAFNKYGLDLNLNLIGENRGSSYGVYNSKSMIVYPKYGMGYDKEFKILDQILKVGIYTGNFNDMRVIEGLTFYNLDGQGTKLYIQSGKFKLSYQKIGDLKYWIGLNIGDANNYWLSLDGFELLDSLKADFKIGTYDYYPSLGNGQTYSLALNYKKLRVYSEVDIKSDINRNPIRWNSGLLLGANYDYNENNIKIKTRMEYRYYGYLFNQDRYNKLVTYRGNGTIGQYLYPLNLYDRPFSQWAVFTEYQNKNVSCLTWQFDLFYNFYDNFNLHCNLDMNYIQASNLEPFLYPFYNFGLTYEAIKDVYLQYSFTNKSMNLDSPYPTFNLYTQPVNMLSFYYKFRF